MVLNEHIDYKFVDILVDEIQISKVFVQILRKEDPDR